MKMNAVNVKNLEVWLSSGPAVTLAVWSFIFLREFRSGLPTILPISGLHAREKQELKSTLVTGR